MAFPSWSYRLYAYYLSARLAKNFPLVASWFCTRSTFLHQNFTPRRPTYERSSWQVPLLVATAGAPKEWPNPI